jgi:hypothetical protein
MIKYIYTQNCGPCKLISPIIDSFISVGYDINKIPLAEFQAETKRSIPTPTILVEEDGKVIANYPASLIVGADALLNYDSSLVNFSSTADFIKSILDKHTKNSK